MPTPYTLGRHRVQRFEAPIRRIEVQGGKIAVTTPDDVRRTKAAGQSAEPGDRTCTAEALDGSLLLVTTTDEAKAAEAREAEQAEREATKAAQGEAADPPARAPMKPPVR